MTQHAETTLVSDSGDALKGRLRISRPAGPCSNIILEDRSLGHTLLDHTRQPFQHLDLLQVYGRPRDPPATRSYSSCCSTTSPPSLTTMAREMMAGSRCYARLEGCASWTLGKVWMGMIDPLSRTSKTEKFAVSKPLVSGKAGLCRVGSGLRITRDPTMAVQCMMPLVILDK